MPLYGKNMLDCPRGRVAERLKAHDSKSCRPLKGLEGSNPSPSAIQLRNLRRMHVQCSRLPSLFMPTLLLVVTVLFAIILQPAVSFAASEKKELRACYQIQSKTVSEECIRSVRGRLRAGTLQNTRPFGGGTGIKVPPTPKKTPPASSATLRQCQKFESKEDRSRCEKETLQGIRKTIFRARKQTRRTVPPSFAKPGRRPCDQFDDQEERTQCLQQSRALRTADTDTIRRGGRQIRKP